jgi:hypothetical protein
VADLSGQNTLKYEFEVDEDTGFTTITVSDSSNVVLDTLIIENNRCRTFLESLSTIAKEYFPDTVPTLQRSRTTVNKNAGTAELEFV